MILEMADMVEQFRAELTSLNLTNAFIEVVLSIESLKNENSKIKSRVYPLRCGHSDIDTMVRTMT